jgi:hypothetical protein
MEQDQEFDAALCWAQVIQQLATTGERVVLWTMGRAPWTEADLAIDQMVEALARARRQMNALDLTQRTQATDALRQFVRERPEILQPARPQPPQSAPMPGGALPGGLQQAVSRQMPVPRRRS